jgi:hypothetical protein
MRVFIGSDPRSEPDYEAVLSKIPAGYTHIPWGPETEYDHLQVDDYLLLRQADKSGAPDGVSILFKVTAKLPLKFAPEYKVSPDENWASWTPGSQTAGFGQTPIPPPVPEMHPGVLLRMVANYYHPEAVGSVQGWKAVGDKLVRAGLWTAYKTYKAPVLSPEEYAQEALRRDQEVVKAMVPAGFIRTPWTKGTTYSELNTGDYLVFKLDSKQFGGGLPKIVVTKIDTKEAMPAGNTKFGFNYIYNEHPFGGLPTGVAQQQIMPGSYQEPEWWNYVTYRRPNPPSSDVREAGMVAASGDWPIPPGVVIGVIVVGLGLWYFLKNRPK